MASNGEPFTTLDPDEVRDLGFGEAVAQDSRRRLLNRDGTFNAGRHGLLPWEGEYAWSADHKGNSRYE